MNSSLAVAAPVEGLTMLKKARYMYMYVPNEQFVNSTKATVKLLYQITCEDS